MSELSVLRWIAALTGISAAIMVSLHLSQKFTAWGFVIFTLSSITWTVAGWMEDEPSLMTQNIVLTIINLVGIYRWFDFGRN
ncbi:MAG TPA: hypothetical protein DDW95_04590 [Alphaproteobacteria bacterium]|jgi:uncharacterized membrane protein YphA (DoxX/SURF4 family)|nr:hypothetical protein [Alphaproteobacteria bacterium]HAM49124.1 hypothetical protein [Alphaproteobacteria bacterium]HBA41414.1 hypothetical protein [Alphaproteobacteria bacterium]HBC52853.1 hypothetical protein [Alphaproteobacteria bacterium]HBF97807.1 hypothetical protein [Alphaproteobacteria bacterium]